jgi:hypothetical protein
MIKYSALFLFFVFCSTHCAGQATSEAWAEFSEYGITYKLPSKQQRYRNEGTELPAEQDMFKPAFVNGQTTSFLRAKAEGDKIRCGIMIMRGKVIERPDSVAAAVAESIKKEFASEPVFTLAKAEISKLDGQIRVYLSFQLNTQALVSTLIIFSNDVVVLLGTEDASTGGKESEYFFNELGFL